MAQTPLGESAQVQRLRRVTSPRSAHLPLLLYHHFGPPTSQDVQHLPPIDPPRARPSPLSADHRLSIWRTALRATDFGVVPPDRGLLVSRGGVAAQRRVKRLTNQSTEWQGSTWLSAQSHMPAHHPSIIARRHHTHAADWQENRRPLPPCRDRCAVMQRPRRAARSGSLTESKASDSSLLFCIRQFHFALSGHPEPLRANDDETPDPREFRLEGAEG